MDTDADGYGLSRFQERIINGEARRDHIASFRCVADPEDNFLGRYFFQGEFDASLEEGVMPTGSVWLNDHSHDVFEVEGDVGEAQRLAKIDPSRLKMLELRHPRLRRALSNPLVS